MCVLHAYHNVSVEIRVHSLMLVLAICLVWGSFFLFSAACTMLAHSWAFQRSSCLWFPSYHWALGLMPYTAVLDGCGYGSLSVGPHACTATLYLLVYFLNLTFCFIHFSLCFSLYNFYHMYTALRIFSSSISSLPLMPPNVSFSPSCIFLSLELWAATFKIYIVCSYFWTCVL